MKMNDKINRNVQKSSEGVNEQLYLMVSFLLFSLVCKNSAIKSETLYFI